MTHLNKIAGLVVFGAMILTSTQVFAGPNCTCRYKGGEVNEGQTACLKTSSGSTLARCERVLNNTSWKMLEQACPIAQMQNQNLYQSGQKITLAELASSE